MKITVDNNGIGREVTIFYENEKAVAVFRREEDYEIAGYPTYTPSGELVRNWEGEATHLWEYKSKSGIWLDLEDEDIDENGIPFSYVRNQYHTRQIYRAIPQKAKMLSAEQWYRQKYRTEMSDFFYRAMQSYAEYYHHFFKGETVR